MYIFSRLRSITFKLGNLSNIKALFPGVSTDFPNWSMSKVKKSWKGLLTIYHVTVANHNPFKGKHADNKAKLVFYGTQW